MTDRTEREPVRRPERVWVRRRHGWTVAEVIERAPARNQPQTIMVTLLLPDSARARLIVPERETQPLVPMTEAEQRPPAPVFSADGTLLSRRPVVTLTVAGRDYQYEKGNLRDLRIIQDSTGRVATTAWLRDPVTGGYWGPWKPFSREHSVAPLAPTNGKDRE